MRFAIDDYGVGHSWLCHLKRMPVDLLKIDRSFVAELGEDPEDTAILGLQVVAEGVKTADQLAKLEELGCDLAQGFTSPNRSRAKPCRAPGRRPPWVVEAEGFCGADQEVSAPRAPRPLRPQRRQRRVRPRRTTRGLPGRGRGPGTGGCPRGPLPLRRRDDLAVGRPGPPGLGGSLRSPGRPLGLPGRLRGSPRLRRTPARRDERGRKSALGRGLAKEARGGPREKSREPVAGRWRSTPLKSYAGRDLPGSPVYRVFARVGCSADERFARAARTSAAVGWFFGPSGVA